MLERTHSLLSISLINLGHAMAGSKPEHMDTTEERRFWNSTFLGPMEAPRHRVDIAF